MLEVNNIIKYLIFEKDNKYYDNSIIIIKILFILFLKFLLIVFCGSKNVIIK